MFTKIRSASNNLFRPLQLTRKTGYGLPTPDKLIVIAVAAILLVLLVHWVNKASSITRESTVHSVSQRSEVKDWLALFEDKKQLERKPVIEFDHMDGRDYVIHVYELVRYTEPNEYEKQNNLSGHTATFNWYKVNARTGQIDPQF